MTFEGFTQKDFDVFTIDGLEERMEGIIKNIRPKFESLASHFTPFLSTLSGNEMFSHIAKHARRTVNPPKDTWIAFSSNKRGYKMTPHFQIGLWNTHLFIWFAIIYESPVKGILAEKMTENLHEIKHLIPPDFVWSWDHTSKEVYPHGTLEQSDLMEALRRLKEVKKAEILCGLNIDRKDPILNNGTELLNKIETTYRTLMPLYKLPS